MITWGGARNSEGVPSGRSSGAYGHLSWGKKHFHCDGVPWGDTLHVSARDRTRHAGGLATGVEGSWCGTVTLGDGH